MLMRLYIPVYSLTLLISAFLLFSIQPLFAKMILPLMGGGPSVWNVSMVFFQAMLLAGYAYAHAIVRFANIRWQTALHILLLVLCGFFLPVAVPENWQPPSGDGFPAGAQLMMMAIAIGGPFFILSASAPLFQHWFTHTNHHHAESPYFLYAISNFGSITALISYPVIIEPLITLSLQKQLWGYGYMTLSLLAIMAAWLVITHYRQSKQPSPDTQKQTQAAIAPVSWPDRIKWLWLSFLPSSLLLGVTTYITTDVASAPLLWVVPLILYLLTFIIAFSHIAHDKYMKPLLIAHAVLLICVLSNFMREITFLNIYYTLAMHFLLFFASALLCHTELVKSKPHHKHLTEFYLLMSLGGVLGGIFNALIAPLFFIIALEYPLILGLAATARFQSLPEQSWYNFKTQIHSFFKRKEKTPWSLWIILAACLLSILAFWTGPESPLFYSALIFSIMAILIMLFDQRWAFALTATLSISLIYPASSGLKANTLLSIERNYFGTLKVFENTEDNLRMAMHNTTNHGIQSLLPALEYTPLAYYHHTTPNGDIFSIIRDTPSPQKVAILGLGAGGLACYSAPGRHFDFYEIDPAVVRMAENPELFTFLSGCGSPYKIIMGDGRIKISEAADNSYDIIYMDAFSSDAIPIHLITVEALQTYIAKLKDIGFIAVHISNRHLSLGPVLYSTAKELGINALYKSSVANNAAKDTLQYIYSTSYVILTHNQEVINKLRHVYDWIHYPFDQAPRAWTDDYANILAALKKDKNQLLIGLSEQNKDAAD